VERGVPWRTLWQIAGMSMGMVSIHSAHAATADHQRIQATRTAEVTVITLAACSASSSPPASSAVECVPVWHGANEHRAMATVRLSLGRMHHVRLRDWEAQRSASTPRCLS
jgi:hypothetical protein